MPSQHTIEIYTDGSCHTQLCVGAWVAIVLAGGDPVILTGTADNTTHHRMELMAVIKALEYVKANTQPVNRIILYSDSQYVIDLPARIRKLAYAEKIQEIRHADLVQEFAGYIATLPVEYLKIKGHQKKATAINHNREADMLCRRLVREIVAKLPTSPQ